MRILLFSILFSAFYTNVYAQKVSDYTVYKKWKYKKADSLRGKLGPERSCYDVFYYDLDVTIDIRKKRIQGKTEIHFLVKRNTKTIQIDLHKKMILDSIFYQGKQLTFRRLYDAVFVDFPESLTVNSKNTIDVYYQGKPKMSDDTRKGRHGFHWKRDDKNRPWIGVSCEHDGASMWWPNKDHLSDEPDSMRIHITAPYGLSCISNGILESKTPVNESLIKHNWFVNNPINNYNVTFYLGHYTKAIIPYKDNTIYIFALDHDEKYMQNYFQYVPHMVSFFEKTFGEYPFWNDKFAIIQSPYLGMEHQTCLAIGKEIGYWNNWYYSEGVNYHSTLIHEIAHEWWGNSVTISDMADAWLQEGFATYAEMLFIESISDKKTYEKSIERLKINIQRIYPIVGNRDVNDNTFINGDIYYRGAVVIHELRESINDYDTFVKILQTFQKRFKMKTVTTADFIEVVNEVTGKNYTKFLMDRLYKR